MKQIFIVALFVLTVSLLAEQTGTLRRVIAADYSGNRRQVAFIEPDGTVKWKHTVSAMHDLHVLPDGHVLFQTDWTHVVEVDAAGKTVWQYDAGKSNGNEGNAVEVHAFQRLPNGVTMIAESGPGRIIEVDKDGKLLKQIKLTLDHPDAHRDTRNARKLANGHYLVAHEGDAKVREYDGEGKVVWQFDVPLFGKPPKPGHGVEAFGNQVYSAIRLPNGNTLIGTGNGHSVLEVAPDKKIVWKLEQNDLPGIQFAWVTQVARRANGNTIVVNCHAGPNNPQIVEVTPDKKVVWTFKDHKNFGDATATGMVLDGDESVVR